MATRAAQQRQSYGGVPLALENDPRLTAIPTGGLAGQILSKATNTSYDTAWIPAPSGGGGGGGLTPTAVKTAAYAAASGDLVLVNAAAGAITITAPAGATSATFGVKKVDSSVNAVTVVGASGATIDGDTSCVLYAAETAVTFVWAGASAWQIQGTAIIGAGASSALASTSDKLLVPTFQSGWWYDRRAGAPSNMGGLLTIAPPVSQIQYLPFYLHKAVTIDQLALGVTAAGSASVRLGVYSAIGGIGAPGSLLADAGTIATVTASTIGARTLASSLTIPAGWAYFAVSHGSGTTNTYYGLQAYSVVAPVQGIQNASFTFANAGQVGGIPYYTETGSATATPSMPVTASPFPALGVPAQTVNVYYHVV